MKWKFYVFMLLAILLVTPLAAQIKTKISTDPPLDIFRAGTAKSAGPDLPAEITVYGILETDPEKYAQLRSAAPETWTLRLPATSVNPDGFTLQLRRNDFLRPDFRLRRASTGEFVGNPDLGDHYVGEIIGEPGSRVALSLLDGEMTAVLDRSVGDRLALGLVKSSRKSATKTTYALYPDQQVINGQELDCATPDSGIPYTDKEIAAGREKSAGGCVDVYFEIDYDIYLDKGGLNAAAQHLAANFNEVSILYQTLDVNLSISEITVWDKASPYSGTSSSSILTQFQSQRKSFNGDIAQLVSYKASGGIAVLDGLCHPYIAARMSFASIRSTFRAVPTYSWSTMVIAHELGHLLGSQHTHACVWNGNNTAIDGCPGWTEGSCGTPGIPQQGGTMMSYCHLRSVGINFLLGFGDQPGAVIRKNVADAQGCVQAACGGGNPPPPPPPPPGGGDGGNDDPPSAECDAQTVYVRLTLDDFGMETTWRLRSETGATLASGGPYPKKQKGRQITDTLCVPDGCYVFEISDSDFDGICCDYGNGNYELRDGDNNVIGSGSSFDTLDVVDFCLPDMPPPPDGACNTLDFSSSQVVPYGTNQDIGRFTVQENGNVLLIEQNAWKKVEMSYTITPDTWLSFWFKSTKKGEVHGIGFDDNDVISSNLTFRLYGSQSWGRNEFANYPGDGSWKYYEINVGQYYTGLASNLFFTADHDVGSRDGNSYFRSVTISEGTPCRPANLLDLSDRELPAPAAIELVPNPATSMIRVDLTHSNPGTVYRIVDTSGRTVRTGELPSGTLEVSVADLPASTYIFRVENGEDSLNKRFTVVH